MEVLHLREISGIRAVKNTQHRAVLGQKLSKIMKCFILKNYQYSRGKSTQHRSVLGQKLSKTMKLRHRREVSGIHAVKARSTAQ
jgi:hypothetical protein